MAQVKICGLRRPDHIVTAAESGARFVGFVFFPKSPRAVSAEEAALLIPHVPVGVARVGLFVNPDDAFLDHTLGHVPLDIIQLHGSEDPDRVAAVKALTGLPVMKAVGLAGPDDLAALTNYGLVADMLLVDAKPSQGGDLPGGNGLPFDWRLLVGRTWLGPWMLAGGLTPQNVAEAIRLTGAPAVDVSSGVEIEPGEKDEGLIRAFVAAAS